MTEITKDTFLTIELLKELKDEYKKIYKTTLLDGTDIIWHRLARADYKRIMSSTKENFEDNGDLLWKREEETCKACVVFPCKEVFEEILMENAGLATVLSDDIYEKSGFKMLNFSEEVEI
jgi:hypothetical protein